MARRRGFGPSGVSALLMSGRCLSWHLELGTTTSCALTLALKARNLLKGSDLEKATFRGCGPRTVASQGVRT